MRLLCFLLSTSGKSVSGCVTQRCFQLGKGMSGAKRVGWGTGMAPNHPQGLGEAFHGCPALGTVYPMTLTQHSDLVSYVLQRLTSYLDLPSSLKYFLT